MATGASTADLAVILVDARKGVLTQTRRHAILVSLLGIRQVVLAVNKMDLVGYDAATCSTRSSRSTGRSPRSSACRHRCAIPISALQRRQHHRAPSAEHALVSRADPDATTSRRVEVEDERRSAAVPHAGAVGQPARTSISAASPARSPAAASSRGDPMRVAAVGPREPRSTRHRHRGRRPAERRSPARR